MSTDDLTIADLSALIRSAPDPTGPLPTIGHLAFQRAAYESHQSSNTHYHYDLPPHNLSSLGPLRPPSDPAHLYRYDTAGIPDPSQHYVFGPSSSASTLLL
jgi:hypothetical protein